MEKRPLLNHQDNQDISLEDIISANIFDNNNDELLWDMLIQQIIDGNVIPVIGADMLIENRNNLHDLIVEGIARKLDICKIPQSFSELIYSREYKNRFNKLDKIYYQVDSIFA